MDIRRDPPKKTTRNILIGLGVAALIGITAFVANLDPAVPTMDRANLWTDSVRRGDMIRAVSAAGNLVPEHVRIVSAVTSGRVEEVPLRPGAVVTPTTLLVLLSNPDLTVTMLRNDQDLARAERELTSLRNSQKAQLIGQEQSVASLELAERADKRSASLADSTLRPGMVMSVNEAANARERLADTQRRLKVERQRLEDMKVELAEELRLTQENVARTRAILEEDRRRSLSLRVMAGETGVLKSINLELGQYVNAGAELARIVRPEMLKVTLRVPESQATDVAIGQSVSIDLHNNTTARGRVTRIDPSAQSGTVNVDVAFEGGVPAGARADQSVDGTIEIEKLSNVLHVGRPVNGQAESTVSVFVLSPDGTEAVRRQVKLGKTSVSTVQVIEGLAVGEKIITIDMADYESANKVKIKG